MKPSNSSPYSSQPHLPQQRPRPQPWSQAHPTQPARGPTPPPTYGTLPPTVASPLAPHPAPASSIPLGSSGQTVQKGARRQHQPPPGGKSYNVRYLLAGGSLLAGMVLIGDVSKLFQPAAPRDICQEVVQPESVLSRDELSQLLTISERESKSAVRNVVSEPYCLMPSVEVRAGVMAEREAYPLAFDPQTWFVVLYEGDEYAGYAFSFQR